jgi:hypothetical protein
MEDPHLILDAPRPRKPLPFLPYDVSLPSGRIARMLPIHAGVGISNELVQYLANEMNEEVVL